MPEMFEVCATCGKTFGAHRAKSPKLCPSATGRGYLTTSFVATPAAPKTVWVLTHGSYSDYSIYAVCATEALAIELRDLDTKLGLLIDSNDPFEMTLYDAVPPVIEYASREATWGANRDTPEIKRHDQKYRTFTGKDFEITDKPEPLSKPRFLRVEGTDPDRVDKIFSDRVAQIMAERMGIA